MNSKLCNLKASYVLISFFETVAKVNSLVDFGGKTDKRYFDRAERIKYKALRVSAQGVYFR